MHDHLNIDLTLEEFYQDCLSNGFSKGTITSYRSSLRTWKDFISQKGISYLPEVTKDILIEYSHYLQSSYTSPKGKSISARTQEQKIAALKSYLNYCSAAGKILLNPSECLKYPKIPKSLPKGVLTKRQMKRLLNMPNTRTFTGYRDRVILELFYSTGIRRNELVSIELEDCHLNERRLFIRNGKGGTQRWVPLGKQVTKILRQYLKEIRPQLVGDNIHNVLIVGDKGKQVKGPRIRTIVKSYVDKLGLNTTCHGLRHTCATHLLKGKANVRVIQEILGHAKLDSTQIYTRVDIADMTKAIEKSHPREEMLCDQY